MVSAACYTPHPVLFAKCDKGEIEAIRLGVMPIDNRDLAMLAPMPDTPAGKFPGQRRAEIRIVLHAAEKFTGLNDSSADRIAVAADGMDVLGHPDDIPFEERMRNDSHQSRFAVASS